MLGILYSVSNLKREVYVRNGYEKIFILLRCLALTFVFYKLVITAQMRLYAIA